MTNKEMAVSSAIFFIFNNKNIKFFWQINLNYLVLHLYILINFFMPYCIKYSLQTSN